MLDFGWPELFLIIAVAVIVIGPDEIPAVMVALGRVVRRLQYVRYAISQQFDDVMRDADLDDIRKSVNFEAKDEDGNDIEFDEAAADEEYAHVEVDEGEGEKSMTNPENAPENKKSEEISAEAKPIVSHLVELRTRLLWVIGIMVLGDNGQLRFC